MMMKVSYNKIWDIGCYPIINLLSKMAVTLESYHLIEIVDDNGKNVRENFKGELEPGIVYRICDWAKTPNQR